MFPTSLGFKDTKSRRGNGEQAISCNKHPLAQQTGKHRPCHLLEWWKFMKRGKEQKERCQLNTPDLIDHVWVHAMRGHYFQEFPDMLLRSVEFEEQIWVDLRAVGPVWFHLAQWSDLPKRRKAFHNGCLSREPVSSCIQLEVGVGMEWDLGPDVRCCGRNLLWWRPKAVASDIPSLLWHSDST